MAAKGEERTNRAGWIEIDMCAALGGLWNQVVEGLSPASLSDRRCVPYRACSCSAAQWAHTRTVYERGHRREPTVVRMSMSISSVHVPCPCAQMACLRMSPSHWLAVIAHRALCAPCKYKVVQACAR